MQYFDGFEQEKIEEITRWQSTEIKE